MKIQRLCICIHVLQMGKQVQKAKSLAQEGTASNSGSKGSEQVCLTPEPVLCVEKCSSWRSWRCRLALCHDKALWVVIPVSHQSERHRKCISFKE